MFFAMVVLAFILFGNGIKGSFVYDDVWVINENPLLGKLNDIPKIFVSPYHYFQPETGLYRPLTVASFSLNTVLSKKPELFHITNIFIHALNSFLVFLLIFKMFKSKKTAYGASFLFLFLPIHTEAVTFISGRADILAFLFSITTLIFILERKYWLGAASFLLALLAKESAIGLIPVICLMLFESKHRLIPAMKEAAKFIPSGILYLILRWSALKSHFLGNDASQIYNPLKFTDPLSRFYTALKVMLLYIWKTFVPAHLSADYSYNQIPLIKTFFNWNVLTGIIFLSLLSFLIFSKRARGTPLRFGSLFFVSTFFIISNFIVPIGTIMAERTFYMPSLGIAIIVAYGLGALMDWRFKKLWLILFSSALIFYGLVVISHNTVWSSEENLFTDMALKSPMSVHAKTNLGLYYIRTSQWDKGKSLLEDAYKIGENHLPLLDSLAIVAEHEHRYKDAEQLYLRALDIYPYSDTTLSNLGRLYFASGQYQKTANIYLRAFGYVNKPNFLLAYAMSESKLGNYDMAIETITKYYGEMPSDTGLQFALGYAYFKKGNRAKADQYFKSSKDPNVSEDEFIKSLERF